MNVYAVGINGYLEAQKDHGFAPSVNHHTGIDPKKRQSMPIADKIKDWDEGRPIVCKKCGHHIDLCTCPKPLTIWPIDTDMLRRNPKKEKEKS